MDENESSSIYAKGINFGIFVLITDDEDIELSIHGKRVQWQANTVIVLTFSDATEQNMNTRDGT